MSNSEMIPTTFVLTPHKKRRRWLIGIALSALVGLGFFTIRNDLAFGIAFGDSGSSTDKKDRGAVIGHLGGVPVSIPRVYAFLLEYDGDPHFTEKRKKPAPQRTYESGISSFGFEVRFPDMTPRRPEDRFKKAKGSESIYNSMWLSVDVLSNSMYGSSGDGFLERTAARLKEPQGHFYTYVELPGETYELKGYAPVGVDEKRRSETQTRGADTNDKNIYVHKGADGHVDSHVECSNVSHLAAPCRMRFEMLPNMRAHVSVSFRRDLLPQWQEIQKSIRKVILGFRIEKPIPQINP